MSFHALNMGSPNSTSNDVDSITYVFTKETGLREPPIAQAKFISLLKGWVVTASMQLSLLLVISLCKERQWDGGEGRRLCHTRAL